MIQYILYIFDNLIGDSYAPVCSTGDFHRVDWHLAKFDYEITLCR